MAEKRRHYRYHLEESDKFEVVLEFTPFNKVNATLRDISLSGISIIANLQVFLQNNKTYKLMIKDTLQENIVLSTHGKTIWYMRSNYKENDSLFYGLEFIDEIKIPQEILRFSK